MTHKQATERGGGQQLSASDQTEASSQQPAADSQQPLRVGQSLNTHD